MGINGKYWKQPAGSAIARVGGFLIALVAAFWPQIHKIGSPFLYEYQDEIHGSILEQVDKALEVIYLKYMRAKIRYEGVQRIERYFVPEDALREALLNAICHKQYQSGIPIQISVYEDRLYVANVGSLPENWTIESLMAKHSSVPYNPNIASVFYLAGFIESWGAVSKRYVTR